VNLAEGNRVPYHPPGKGKAVIYPQGGRKKYGARGKERETGHQLTKRGAAVAIWTWGKGSRGVV